MANLLRLGYTMLNIACPVCNNPLFRDTNKEMLCPICNKKVIFDKDKVPPNSSVKEKQDEIFSKKSNFKLFSLKEILEEKLNWLSQKLKDETQIDLIERYMKLLIKLYNFMTKIDKNNASAGI